MQHRIATDFHRTTKWRRRKRLDAIERISRHGRREHSDKTTGSFIYFVASVITLLKEKGYVHYGDIFQTTGRSNRRCYYRAPSEVLEALLLIGLPPAMMAVATCEMVPLNYHTRGGPDSASANDLFWKARAAVRKTEFDRLRDQLRKDGYSEKDIDVCDRCLADLSDKDRRPILAELLQDQGSEEERHFLGHRQSATNLSCKGTPPHRVNFIGANLSRAMASYWRKHRQFQECKEWLWWFLKSAPSHPYRNSVVTIPKLANAKFDEFMRSRRIEKTQALN